MSAVSTMLNEMDTSKLQPYRCRLRLRNKLLRFCWSVVYAILFRPFRLRQFNHWRVFLLRCFGAKMGRGCVIHATAEIWAPWNLDMGAFVCLAPRVVCYNPAKITFGSKVAISQQSYLCTASHDITTLERPLITKPVVIADYAWVCACVFVGPGVTIGQGAVVGAGGVVMKDVAPWTVVAGNPATVIKKRVIREK